MKIELKDIPSYGCVKVITEGSEKCFTISRYEVRSTLSLILLSSEESGLQVLVEDENKHWHVNAKKYEHHPNIRVILTGSEVMLEPGTAAPNFRVRG